MRDFYMEKVGVLYPEEYGSEEEMMDEFRRLVMDRPHSLK